MSAVLKRCPECNAAHVPEGKARCTPCENHLEELRRRERVAADCGPRDDVGEAVRHIFAADNDAELTARYKAATDKFAGTDQRGELKLRVWFIAYGNIDPQTIEKRVRRYYAELAASDDRRRKGPGFEFL